LTASQKWKITCSTANGSIFTILTKRTVPILVTRCWKYHKELCPLNRVLVGEIRRVDLKQCNAFYQPADGEHFGAQ
jgi:hypothetical protein